MKLRNKKTGEIGRLYFDHQLIDPKTGTYAIVIQHRDRLGYEAFANYFTLAELNEEWEDVEDINVPNMPLIKDEEIRKIIRAWADVNDGGKLKYNYDENSLNDIYRNTITFNRGLGLEDGHSYTIPELCGEEEE